MKVYIILANPSVPVYANTPEEALHRYRLTHPEDDREYIYNDKYGLWEGKASKEAEAGICVRIGKKIAELRKEKGLTQRDLADVSGLNASNIARIEKGKYSVGLVILAKIAEAVGADISITKKA